MLDMAIIAPVFPTFCDVPFNRTSGSTLITDQDALFRDPCQLLLLPKTHQRSQRFVLVRGLLNAMTSLVERISGAILDMTNYDAQTTIQ